MNDNLYSAYNHACNCIPRCTDLVHMVEMLKIAYGRSWKSQRLSWMRIGEEVGINISKNSVGMYMGLNAGRNRWNVIGHCHLSPR